MSRIVIAALLMLFVFPNNSLAETALKPDLRACVSGLKAVEDFVRENKPELDPDYFSSLYGWEAFKADNKSYEQFANVQPSSMSDIKHCSHYTLNGADINILMSHVYGFAPDNPEDKLARCFSAFISMAGVVDSKFGPKKGEALGKKIGFKVGKAVSTLDKLYKNIHTSLEILQQKAMLHVQILSKLDDTDRLSALRQNVKSCEWFSVPLMSMIESAAIGAGTR